MDDYFNHKNCLGGKNSICKCCILERNLARNKGVDIQKRVNLEERDGILGKECVVCTVWKSLEAYSKKIRGLGGCRSECKNCTSKRDQKHYKVNREMYIDNAQNWKQNNPEKYRENHRNWIKANPEKVLIKRQNRRARKHSLPDNFTIEQNKMTFEYFGGCALTGESYDIHWDHVIPLATGIGGTTYGNMIPLRSDLNLSKNDCNIFEWFEANRQRFELSQERFDTLIEWLASANAMSVEEYRDYVYWCHNNPRTIDEINEKNESEAI
jgi:hypothetical protein